MEGLQRSAVSFRRQGSSGLIWDDRFLSGELKRFSDCIPLSSDVGDQVHTTTNDQSQCSKTTIRSANTVRRNRSRNGGERSALPVTEPPSPRILACGLCRAFGKRNKTRPKTESRKRSDD